MSYKILILIFSFLSLFVKSQTFNIIDKYVLSNDIVEKYTSALSNADMEKFRGKTITKTFQFTDGVKFNLISAKQLFISGQSIDLNLYKDERLYNYTEPIFFLTDKGFLLTQYKKLEKQ